ncbi:pyroglutamyl-peptidase I family protein [Streptomyces sp. NBC_00557]|uniref:pyroglutamyl-peptidase I family protein n=1 Tax=Streptomyces sp. NBC_00557 TaxID=2975776 RepID=UPI003FCCED55
MTNSLSSPSEATVSRVLLTGVEPFGRNSVNSAWEACRLVAESPPENMQLEAALLPCAFGDSISELRKQILRVEPELVISTGQGGSRPDITIERVAINLNDAEGADNNGHQPIDEPTVADGPAAYRWPRGRTSRSSTWPSCSVRPTSWTTAIRPPRRM